MVTWPGRSTTRPGRPGRGRRPASRPASAARRSRVEQRLERATASAWSTVGEPERHQPVTEHRRGTGAGCRARSAGKAQPCARKSASRVGRAGPSSAAPKRVKLSRHSCSSELVHAAEVGVHRHRRGADLRLSRRAVTAPSPSSQQAGGDLEQRRGDVRVPGTGHLTSLHHTVIDNSVMLRSETQTRPRDRDQHLAERGLRPGARGGHRVRPAGHRHAPGRARRPLPAQRPEPGRAADPATYHWFTGDGMVHGVRLRDGRAEWYRNRWVRSTAVSDGARRARPPGERHGGMDDAPTPT